MCSLPYMSGPSYSRVCLQIDEKDVHAGNSFCPWLFMVRQSLEQPFLIRCLSPVLANLSRYLSPLSYLSPAHHTHYHCYTRLSILPDMLIFKFNPFIIHSCPRKHCQHHSCGADLVDRFLFTQCYYRARFTRPTKPKRARGLQGGLCNRFSGS